MADRGLKPSISPDYVLWTNPEAQEKVPNTGGPQRYIGDGVYRRFPLPGGETCRWLTSGANGSDVWGLASGSKVYRLKAKPVEPVPMERVSAAFDGTVWGIRDDVPHRLTNGQWQAMPGKMSWISCGSALEVWAIDDTWTTGGGKPFRWSGTAWVQRGDLKLRSISAARDPRIVVATTYDGRVVKWTPGSAGTWTEISSTPFIHVISANSKTMVGSDLGNFYEWNGHSWTFMYGAKDGGWVSLADDGTVVVTDANRQVWRSSGIAGFVRLPIPPALSACAVDANSVWTWNASASGGHYWPGEAWEEVAGAPSLRFISVGVDGSVFGNSTHVYRYHASDGSWEQMPGTPLGAWGGQVSAGSAAHIIVLDYITREVRRWNAATNAWDALPIVPLSSDTAGIGGDGTILAEASFFMPTGRKAWNVYRYDDAPGWSWVPDLNLEWIKVCSANLISGEVDAGSGRFLLWIGRLPARATEEPADFRTGRARSR